MKTPPGQSRGPSRDALGRELEQTRAPAPNQGKASGNTEGKGPDEVKRGGAAADASQVSRGRKKVD